MLVHTADRVEKGKCENKDCNFFWIPIEQCQGEVGSGRIMTAEAPQSSVLKLQCECNILMGQVLSSAGSRG